MSVQWGYYFAWVSLTEAETTSWLAFRYITAFSWRRARFRQMVVVRFFIREVLHWLLGIWQERGCQCGVLSGNPLMSYGELDTTQTYLTTPTCFPDPFQRSSGRRKKTPQHGVWEFLPGVMSEGYPSIPSNEYIPWGLIRVSFDVLYELDDCLSHEVRLVNVIFVTDGGHILLEG